MASGDRSVFIVCNKTDTNSVKEFMDTASKKKFDKNMYVPISKTSDLHEFSTRIGLYIGGDVPYRMHQLIFPRCFEHRTTPLDTPMYYLPYIENILLTSYKKHTSQTYNINSYNRLCLIISLASVALFKKGYISKDMGHEYSLNFLRDNKEVITGLELPIISGSSIFSSMLTVTDFITLVGIYMVVIEYETFEANIGLIANAENYLNILLQTEYVQFDHYVEERFFNQIKKKVSRVLMDTPVHQLEIPVNTNFKYLPSGTMPGSARTCHLKSMLYSFYKQKRIVSHLNSALNRSIYEHVWGYETHHRLLDDIINESPEVFMDTSEKDRAADQTIKELLSKGIVDREFISGICTYGYKEGVSNKKCEFLIHLLPYLIPHYDKTIIPLNMFIDTTTPVCVEGTIDNDLDCFETKITPPPCIVIEAVNRINVHGEIKLRFGQNIMTYKISSIIMHTKHSNTTGHYWTVSFDKGLTNIHDYHGKTFSSLSDVNNYTSDITKPNWLFYEFVSMV